VSDDLFPSREEMDWSILHDLDKPHPLVNNSWQPPEPDEHYTDEMFCEMRNVHHLLDMAGVPHGYSMDTRSIDCRVLLLVRAYLRLRDR
jgi:hypothetical protein